MAVLAGGVGSERQVSIESGRCVEQGLKQAGIDVITADIVPGQTAILQDNSIDLFFLALHGQFGEDGQLQQILEDNSLCYTSSGPETCRLAFDKMAAKNLFSRAGVCTPAALELHNDTDITQLQKQLRQLSERFVVKPVRQGSSIGVSMADSPKQAIALARTCLAQFGSCMLEEFIQGQEITVGILDGNALPIIEIRPAESFYNYKAKYHDQATQFLFDTISDQTLSAQVQALALKCYHVLGCRYMARADFILTPNRQLYALEINTIPGLTSHSLLPKAAAKVGYSMSRLCMTVIEAAVRDRKVKIVS